MLEFQGLHTKCKVFIDDVDQTAVQQIYGFLNCSIFNGAPIRIMPDVHAGNGAVIGFTCPVGSEVIPNVVGVDVGCGIQTVALGVLQTDDPWFQKFDTMLRASVPSGFNSREKAYSRDKVKALYIRHLAPKHFMGDPLTSFEADVNTLADKIGTDTGKVWRSLGTLGAGNHFCELDKAEDNKLWLTVHSGSRNFGLRIAEYHQSKAVVRMGKNGGLEWLVGEEAQEYLRDMRVAQKFAMLNRLVMLETLVEGLGFKLPDLEMITSVHNFIGDDNIIRKGAISALAGEKVIIPWNMKKGLILGVGKGNPDWNNSAPHGAGRKMARGKAKRELSLEDFKRGMADAGVWSSCVDKDTLDESAEAYKDPEVIEKAIAPSVEVLQHLRSVYNFKSGGR